MSYLPQISEQQRQANIRKLINQNKKLCQQIFIFEEQMNLVLSNSNQQTKNKLTESQIPKPSSRQKIQFVGLYQTQQLKHQKSTDNQSIYSPQSIQKLLQMNSPLIETKVIPSFKQKVEYLKSLNIKQNIHYILKQEDDLKLVKKQMYKLRKQKQVITDFIKDKTIKLQRQNNELTNHKNSLRQQLNQTIKFNRQSNSNITEIQRQIRKYHLISCQYKRLSLQSKDKSFAIDKNNNPQIILTQTQRQITKIKQQITDVSNKWKDQLDSLDKQYYQLKQQMQKKQNQQKTIQLSQNFHKTRILVMKDQQRIQQQKQKQKLLKSSPKLQKQLQNYLKQQKQKLFKKQQYKRKQRPRDKDQQQFHKLIIQKATKSPNPQNTIVQTFKDDKNIIKLKNYLKQKQKVDKQIQAKIKKSSHQKQSHRLERSWSQNQQQLHLAMKNQQMNLKKKQKQKKQKLMPRILLKSVKMGTTFHNSSEQDNL